MKTLVGAMGLLVLGCGDPLAGGAYLGEELLRLEGEVTVRNDVAEEELAEGALRLAIFWSESGIEQAVKNPVSTIEQQAVTTSTFPSRFALSIHVPPSEGLVQDARAGTGRYAVGLLLVYIDADGDGRWDSTVDELAGGAEETAVIYTPAGVESESLGTLGAGYHAMRVKAGGDGCSDDLLELERTDPKQLRVVIDVAEPTSVLVDIDCDGQYGEWLNLSEELDEACVAADIDVPFVDLCDTLPWCCDD